MITLKKKTATLLLLIAFFALALFSCEKEEALNTDTCIFIEEESSTDGLVDEDENAILESCAQNQLQEQTAIEANLLGTWELYGYGNAWFPNTQQPCITLVFDENQVKVTFKNAFLNTKSINSWSLESTDNGGFYLDLSPAITLGARLNVFCDEYLVGNDMPVDGDMYIFRKTAE